MDPHRASTNASIAEKRTISDQQLQGIGSKASSFDHRYNRTAVDSHTDRN